MQRKSIVLIVALIFLGLGVQSPASASGGGNIFIVNSTADIRDATLNGVCETASGVCTLRAAIQEANATTFPDTIHFNIPGAGPHTIRPTAPFNLIEHPTIIDASTQPGASCPDVLNPADIRIVLDGSTGSNAQTAGFAFRSFADDSLVRGLAIINYAGYGIEAINADNLRIECNHIGIEADGVTAAGNRTGIYINGIIGSSVVIGGTSSDARTQRNVISGNLRYGVATGLSRTSVLITGNYIGTDATGSSAIGNQSGLYVFGENFTVGGAQLYHANVISGNQFYGVLLHSTVDNTTIDNNFIGVNAFGAGSLGNGADGIFIPGYFSGSSTNVIDIGLNAGNVIANNGGNGIRRDNEDVPAGNVTMRFNEIYNNGGLGVDIGDVGVDPELPSNDNNRARLLSISGNALRLAFASPGNGAPYQFDVYHNDACDDSGFGEGQAYVESFTLSVNSAELFQTVTLANSLPSGKLMTVAVTNPLGRTSEFSNCLAEVATFTVDTKADTEDADAPNASCADANGDCSLRAAIQEINASPGAGPFTILFDIPGFDLPSRTIEVDATLGPLPDLSKTVQIDGTSQSNARCASSDSGTTEFPSGLVGLDGTNLSGTDSGLELVAGSDGSTVSGITFAAFPGDGLKVFSNNNRIYCNVFGLFGSSITGNSDDGVQVSGNANAVGGIEVWRRNLMIGNGDSGVELRSDATGNLVQGNQIGTLWGNHRGINVRESAAFNNIGGTAVLISNTVEILGYNVVVNNSDHGIRLVSSGSGNNVGGNYVGVLADGVTIFGNDRAGIRSTSPNTRIGQTQGFLGLLYDVPNVVGGNGESGIHISDFNGVAGTGVLITSNFVGVSADGGTTIGNTNHGILIESDEATVSGNVTAFNGVNGVYMDAGVQDTQVLSNTIHNNSLHGIQVNPTSNRNYFKSNAFADNKGLAIDLHDDGVLLPNDAGDADTGGNDLMNRVEVISAESSNNTVLIDIEDGLPNTRHFLELYRNDSCGKEGTDGQQPINKLDITFTTDAQGDWSDTYSTNDFAAGDGIAAIVSSSFAGSNPSSTSEFSNCVVATGTVVTSVNLSGQSAGVSSMWMTLLVIGTLLSTLKLIISTTRSPKSS